MIGKSAVHHMKRLHSKGKEISKNVQDKIPPLKFTPVKDAFQKLTMKHMIIGSIIIFLFLAVSNVITYIVTNPNILETVIKENPFYGPVFLILFIMGELLISPLPGSISAITAGYFYGIYPGILYAWIGTALSVAIALLLARKFGQPLVKKMMSDQNYSFYSDMMKKHPLIVFVLFAIPIFPIVMISLLLGLSNMPVLYSVAISWAGLVINMLLLSYLGQNIAAFGFNNPWVIIGLLVLAFSGMAILFITVKHSQKPENKPDSVQKGQDTPSPSAISEKPADSATRK